MKTNEQSVKAKFPQAVADNKHTLPVRWVIKTHPIGSAIIGRGNTEEEAWANAAQYINQT